MESLFEITKVVSPSKYGGEEKNQDRAGARCSSPVLTACLCDGVSSSPNAAMAAELCVNFSSLLFVGSPETQLGLITRLLVSYRLSAIDKGINLDDQPESMKTMLEEAVKEKLKSSFQTTLVAGQFTPLEDNIHCKILSCGDSGYFAFDNKGELLFSNLNPTKQICEMSKRSQKIPFGPGYSVTTKIIGPLTRRRSLAEKTNITNGELCEVLIGETENVELRGEALLWLSKGETLIVPSHLVSRSTDPKLRNIAKIGYSRFIQRATAPTKNQFNIKLNNSGNMTCVLPDGFFAGQWDYTEDEFPKDSSFLLCSDGFYRCFTEPLEMWVWLNIYQDSTNKDQLIDELHKKLQNIFGDDDISFISISPRIGKD